MDLEPFFSPKTVAVIGATERAGSVGRTLMTNLASFSGRVYPVNPKHTLIFDQKTYPHIRSIPESIDLAIIATPAPTVPAIIVECVEAKVKTAIIISSGFKEIGAEGIEREEQILFAARGKMRIMGPNCLGLMCPKNHLNATFAHGMALDGSVAFISQSGALCSAVLDWSRREQIGFSAFVSIGSMIDVDWGDLLHYFEEDSKTQSIMMYMESIGNAARFIAAARHAQKPIFLLKSGRSTESAHAAISHTGALAGNDEVFSAAMESCHVLRLDTLSDLFNITQMITQQPQPKGPHLSIVTNAGGPGVIAADALIHAGGQLTPLSANTIEALDVLLPPQWSHNNPIDVLGDAKPDAYAKAAAIALSDPASHAILTILTPQEMSDPTQTAERLLPHLDLPMYACWMGAASVEAGREVLRNKRIPVFEYPDDACKAFGILSRYLNTPSQPLEKVKLQPPHAIIARAHEEKRTLLDEVESKKLIADFGIPIVPAEIAHDAKQAIHWAEKIGYPVVLKIYSHSITHKAKVGGVKLNLTSSADVERAFKQIMAIPHAEGATVQPMIDPDGVELIIGSRVDEEFGPVVLFGAGGKLAEVLQDRSLALPPLTLESARRMMQQTKIFRARTNHQVEEILVCFSRMILQQPFIQECDINPLFVSKNGVIALDARIVLF